MINVAEAFDPGKDIPYYSVSLDRMEKLNPQLLRTKQHFDVLDGLRGIAALAIVVFHFMEWIYTDFSKNFIGHGFLAVDFFFCLSGFVIAYAYDNRIAKMGMAEFFKSRLIRLHPLVILGSVVGLAAFLLDPFAGHSELYSAGKIALLFLCSVFLIPLPIMEERAFNLFGFNAPSWSLFWEYVANIIYALVLYKLSRKYLFLVTLLAAFVLCWAGYRAGTTVSRAWKGICVFSGKISYPLYMTHYAAIWIFGNYFTNNKPDSTTLTYIVITGVLLLVGFSYLVMVLYDTPIRRYLTVRRRKELN